MMIYNLLISNFCKCLPRIRNRYGINMRKFSIGKTNEEDLDDFNPEGKTIPKSIPYVGGLGGNGNEKMFPGGKFNKVKGLSQNPPELESRISDRLSRIFGVGKHLDNIEKARRRCEEENIRMKKHLKDRLKMNDGKYGGILNRRTYDVLLERDIENSGNCK